MRGSFLRAQLSSGIATIADFGTLALLTEWGGVWYVASTAVGAIAGAITNFLINRYWVFEGASEVKGRGVVRQSWRYTLVSVGSWGLNVAGVWWITESWGVYYIWSKAGVAILVGIAYNYPLHRWFVFSPDV